MKIVFFGLGSIGLRHARLLQEMGGHDLIGFRSNLNGRKNILGIQEVFSWEELDSFGAEAAFITNPTFLHIETALACAERGMALFIEKPIASSVENLDRLVGLVQKQKLPSYVAYVLRFHPALQELKTCLKGKKILHAKTSCTSFLPDWRPGRDSRTIYSSKRDEGGGAILDQSHEFDTVDYLFGPVRNIMGVASRVAEVTIDAEDVVDAVVECEHCRVNMHINLASFNKERWVEVDTDVGFFKADLIHHAFFFVSSKDSWKREYPISMDDVYRMQINYFLDGLKKKTSIMNNLEEAQNLFRKIVDFREENLS